MCAHAYVTHDSHCLEKPPHRLSQTPQSASLQQVCERLNSERRIPLQAVVHQHIGLPIVCYSALDENKCLSSHVRKLTDELVVGFRPFLGWIVAGFFQSETTRT